MDLDAGGLTPAFRPGMRAGAYEIIAALGRGGMGEVYHARDLNLRRDVALKVIRPDRCFGDALARFRREAQMLAALNHPNVAAIYGLEEIDGRQVLTMEYVPGMTLAELLATSRPGSGTALGICRQVAEALEATHRAGVIHRDLKPANIKVTGSGVVKVLDFGLAKTTGVRAEDATVTVEMTQRGEVMGTPVYMSPEHALGKDLDERTDIWAFGCLLYEALSGTRAFSGSAASEVIDEVLHVEPDWSRVPAEIPPSILALIKRCLAKDVRRRLQAIGDARLEIEDALEGKGAAAPVTKPPRRWLHALAGLVAGALTVAIAWWAFRGTETVLTGQLIGGAPVSFGPRISPDGQTVAFQAMIDSLNQVAVLKPSSGRWTLLTRDRNRGWIANINWSSDGSTIYYDRYTNVPNGIYSVPAVGGEARLVIENAFGPEALPDGSMLLIRPDERGRRRLHRYRPDTGKVDALNAVASSVVFNSAVRAFPDGKEAVFFGTPANAGQPAAEHLYVINLASQETRRIAPDVRFPAGGYDYFALAPHRDRAIVCAVPEGSVSRIVEVSRDGSSGVRNLLTLTMPVWYLDSHRDGSLYADQLFVSTEVLKFRADGGGLEKIAVLPSTLLYTSARAIPLPDGRVLTVTTSTGREHLMIAEGGKPLRPFIDTAEETTFPAAPAGSRTVAFVIGTGANRRIAIASLPEDRIVRRLSVPASSISSLAASVDGRTIYYSGEGSIYSVPAEDGPVRRIREGDGVSVDARNGDLIVKIVTGDRIRLIRVSPRGESEIAYGGGYYPSPVVPLTPTAIGPDGKLVLQVNSADSWTFKVAVLGSDGGDMKAVPLDFRGDIYTPGWAADGKIVGVGTVLSAAMWRFHVRPQSR